MKHFFIVLFITFCTVSSSFASERLPNRPYVQSMDGGIFYARCIPAEKEGSKGTTTIYRVEAEADEKLDVYDWYAPEGVILGWSPIVGKVAVMALQGRYNLKDNQVVFSFHIGGQHLHSYTAKNLKEMGVRLSPTSAGMQLEYIASSVEQMPLGTNEYVFVVDVNKGPILQKPTTEKLFFDILTGKIRE